MLSRIFSLSKLRAVLVVPAFLVGALPVVGWIGGSFWPLDLLNHFQYAYAGCLTLGAVVLLLLRSFRGAALTALLGVVPLLRIVPGYLSPAPSAAALSSTARPVRVVLFNVYVANRDHAETLRWVRQEDPDLVYFTEVTQEWSVALAALHDAYPHSIDEGSGFAFYSKRAIAGVEIVRCSEIRFPLLVARIPTAHGELTFLGVHPLPPVQAHWAAALQETMAVITREVAKVDGPVILAGDFNTTRWGHQSAQLHRVGLRDAAQGKAPGPTWQRGNPLLGIPIDRILYRGQGMSCRRCEIGPDLGSDHRPLVAEIAW